MTRADVLVWALAVIFLVPALTFAARRLVARPWAPSTQGFDDGAAAVAVLPGGEEARGAGGEVRGLDRPPTDSQNTDAQNTVDSVQHAVAVSPSRAPALSEARLRFVVTLCAGVTAFVAVGILGRFAHGAPGFALALVASLPILTALAVIDVDVHRLPNRLTAALAATVVIGLGLAALVDGIDAGQGRRAVVGALALGAFYLVMALLGGGSGMGLGDVKLAPSLGALLAWAGWNAWLAGAVAAFVLGGAWGVVLMLRGQGRHARMPFGPFMIAGALAALCLA